jgi:hypothetical protein
MTIAKYLADDFPCFRQASSAVENGETSIRDGLAAANGLFSVNFLSYAKR